jgi:putative PIG3 family NAD(P)H quinone oxidoreductase
MVEPDHTGHRPRREPHGKIPVMPSGLPDTMTAVEIGEPGPPDVLRAVTRPRPEPGRGEVLIEVHAAGVNRPDVLQRLGKYPPPPGASDLPGLEVAGRVVERGDGVTWPLEGEAVCALLAGGGYAEFAVAPAPQCLPVPRGLTLVEAAVLPECVFTVWTNVFERGRLAPGEVLLVHGGTSGIGTTAIQMAVAAGARVVATAGSREKCDACVRLGAERAVNYREEDFVASILELTAGAGANLVLDMVGGDYAQRNLDALALEGRLVQIAFLKGPRVEIDLSRVMRQRLTVTGSTLRARSVAEKGAIAEAVRRTVWPQLEGGAWRPVVHASFPLHEAAEAHRLMERGALIGKIALAVK